MPADRNDSTPRATARPKVPERAPSAEASTRRLPHARIAIGVLVLLLAIVTVIGLSDRSAVAAVVVEAEPFSARITVRGRLEASVLALVAAEAPGRVEAVLVREGDSVSAGDPLLRLSADMAREQYRAAAAMAASADDGARSARAEQASATVLLAERRADLERLEPLSGTAVAAADVAAARTAVDKAQADVERAAARASQAEAQATAAAAERDLARQALDDLILRAPIAGVVVARDVDPGDVVGAGAALLRIADPRSLEVVAFVDETAMGGLRAGLPSEVTFLSAAGETASGTVRSIGREVDPETREVELWIALSAAPDRWALGQRVDVTVTAPSGTATTAVPTEMVSWQGTDAGVFVAESGRARWVPVTLGRADRVRVEVASGVSAGDTILAPDGLRAGARVAPVFVVRGEVE